MSLASGRVVPELGPHPIRQNESHQRLMPTQLSRVDRVNHDPKTHLVSTRLKSNQRCADAEDPPIGEQEEIPSTFRHRDSAQPSRRSPGISLLSNRKCADTAGGPADLPLLAPATESPLPSGRRRRSSVRTPAYDPYDRREGVVKATSFATVAHLLRPPATT